MSIKSLAQMVSCWADAEIVALETILLANPVVG